MELAGDYQDMADAEEQKDEDEYGDEVSMQ